MGKIDTNGTGAEGEGTACYWLPHHHLDTLLAYLQQDGFECVGPQVRDKVVQYHVMTSAKQLPWGVKDQQAPGRYSLIEGDSNRAFAWVNGPQAAKPELFKPQEALWKVQRDEHGKLQFVPVQPQAKKVALFAIRPCDLKAIQIQDKVFCQGDYQDARYQQRRRHVFIVVANCTQASTNCFCLSAGGSPKADNGFDLAFTEIEGGLVIQAGSKQGRACLRALQLEEATDHQLALMEEGIGQAKSMQSKTIPKHVASKLKDNLNHPEWQAVTKRCLHCGNCTQVCPTCFCHRETERPSLEQEESVHSREWDSCFMPEHSYIHGKVIRQEPAHRYRQWLTHKFSTWYDQFGTSGCVGCGRCISWCPVGIDVTEELNTICEKGG